MCDVSFFFLISLFNVSPLINFLTGLSGGKMSSTVSSRPYVLTVLWKEKIHVARSNRIEETQNWSTVVALKTNKQVARYEWVATGLWSSMDSIRAVESAWCTEAEDQKGILPAPYPPVIRRQQRTVSRRDFSVGSHWHSKQINVKMFVSEKEK